MNEIRGRTEKNFKIKEDEVAKLNKFWSLNHYISGEYDNEKDFQMLDVYIKKTREMPESKQNILFSITIEHNRISDPNDKKVLLFEYLDRTEQSGD